MKGVVLALAMVGLAEPVLAIPAFARRYQVECVFCHDGFPKLNAVGQSFKERGFRLQREDTFDAGRWIRSVPVVVRANLRRSLFEGQSGFTSSIIKGISAGNLGTRWSYWVDDGLAISSGSTSHTTPDNAWIRGEIIEGGKLYAKVGRIELDLPFTQVRSPHLFGYDAYSQNTGFEVEAVDAHKDGIEIGGGFGGGDLHWSAAVVKGHSEDLSGGSAGLNPDVFLRVAKRLARNRIGGFAYLGRSTLSQPPALKWDDNLLRLGADASIWVERLNLYGVFMYGRNDNSIATPNAPTGTSQPLSSSGGFAQADYHLWDKVVLTLRLNVTNRPPFGTTGTSETLSSLFPGIQVFIFEHGKVSFEYGFLNQGQKSFGAVQAEVAF
jgi:hypothetical protein